MWRKTLNMYLMMGGGGEGVKLKFGPDVTWMKLNFQTLLVSIPVNPAMHGVKNTEHHHVNLIYTIPSF